MLTVANFAAPLRIKQLTITLRPERLFRIGPLAVTGTLLSAWLAMILLLVVAWLAPRRLRDAPAALSLQNIVETVCEALLNIMQAFAGSRAREFFPIIGTLFLFILTLNWIGLLPGFGSIGLWSMEGGKGVLTPILRGSTTDLSTTLALAICSVVSAQIYGFRALGGRAFLSRYLAAERFAELISVLRTEHRFEGGLLLGCILDQFIGLLEIFEELTKVLSFSFRLFGNMFGGEVLLMVMAFLAPYLVSIPFMALEMFGGITQALIFALLSTAFFGRAVTQHGESGAEPDGQHAELGESLAT